MSINLKNEITMSKIVAILFSLLFNAVTGALLGAAVGLSPLTGAIGMNIVSGVIGGALPAGYAPRRRINGNLDGRTGQVVAGRP